MNNLSFFKIVCRVALGACIAAAAPCFAADFQVTPERNAQVDDFVVGKKAIDDKKWQQAIDSFTKVVSKDPKNADAYNYLGFANRWLGRYPEAFDAYGKALTLDPNHKGALNYSGIAYLKTNQKAKAEVQLARLQGLCADCTETVQLSRAVADYRPAEK